MMKDLILLTVSYPHTLVTSIAPSLKLRVSCLIIYLSACFNCWYEIIFLNCEFACCNPCWRKPEIVLSNTMLMLVQWCKVFTIPILFSNRWSSTVRRQALNKRSLVTNGFPLMKETRKRSEHCSRTCRFAKFAALVSDDLLLRWNGFLFMEFPQKSWIAFLNRSFFTSECEY